MRNHSFMASMQALVEEALCGGPVLARSMHPRTVDASGLHLQDVALALDAARLWADDHAKMYAARCVDPCTVNPEELPQRLVERAVLRASRQLGRRRCACVYLTGACEVFV